MRRKFTRVITSILLILFILPALPIQAASNNNFVYTVENGTVTITDYTSLRKGELVIPEEIENQPVTKIGASAFKGISGLTKVTIPNTVISIGDNAFTNCSNADFVLPDSLTEIGKAAFQNTGFVSLTLPSSLNSIGDSAFAGCKKLERVTLSSSLKAISQHAFRSCGKLTSVSIPEGVTLIGSNAFSNCASLTTITLPSSLTKIGASAFENCTALTTVSYTGTDSMWNAIQIMDKNDPLKNIKPTTNLPPDHSGETPDDPDPTPDTVPFTDIKGHWAKASIEWAYKNGFVNGTDPTLFSPEDNMDRGMLAVVLWRLNGKPAVSERAGFDDILAGEYYYTDAVNWAAKNKIVNGTSATTYAPSAYISREQLAAMLYRYAEYVGFDLTKTADLSKYTDQGKVSTWAKDAMSWAVGNGIINGKTAVTLDPSGFATRAEVVTMLKRYSELSTD